MGVKAAAVSVPKPSTLNQTFKSLKDKFFSIAYMTSRASAQTTISRLINYHCRLSDTRPVFDGDSAQLLECYFEKTSPITPLFLESFSDSQKMKKKKPQLLRSLPEGFTSLCALGIIVTSLPSLSSLGILHIPPRSPSITQLLFY